MKITFLFPPPNFSGGCRVVAIYAEGLAKRGHDVSIVATRPAKISFFTKMKKLIKNRQWLKNRTSKDLIKNSHFDGIDGVKIIVLEHAGPIENIDISNADIVIATWWETALWVNDLSKNKGIKVYFMQDYGEVPGQPMDKIQNTWLLPFHIITISQWLVNLIKAYTHQNDQLTLVQNGIELSSFSSPVRNKNKLPTVGFLYTDAPQKGAELMFSAFKKAKLSLPNLRLIMFGSKDLPEKFKCHPDVEYHQKINDKEIVEVYSSCDVWLFGSSREGFGLPILEAMACRTPVIATKAGAAEDLVSSKVGALLCTNSVKEMSSEIVKIMNFDDDSWLALSNGAYQEAKKHSWDSAINKFDDALKASASKI